MAAMRGTSARTVVVSALVLASLASLAIIAPGGWRSAADAVPTDQVIADPVIGAAGDIACSPSNPSFNGGLGTATACQQKATSDLLVNRGLAAVLPVGDEQYDVGALSDFQASYDLSWGRVKSISHHSPP